MTTLLLLLAVGAPAGCWGGGDDDGPEPGDVAPMPAGERVLADTECGGFIPERKWLGPRWRQRSTRIGPVRFLRTSGLEQPGLASRKVLKVPALIPPSHTLTIAIAAEARSSVGFVELSNVRRWTGSPADLYPAIRVENCPPLPPELGVLPAGEFYGHPTWVVVLRDACVPLTVTRDGHSHRGVVSFGGGDCS